MKIAVVIPSVWYSNNPSKFSVNLDLYVQAIVDLGHEPLLICGMHSVYKVAYPVVMAPLENLKKEAFWQEFNIDIAIVFTWLRHAEILTALSSSGAYVVSRADVDGQLSVRVFPWHHYRLSMDGLTNLVVKAISFRHWVNRYFFLSRQADKEVVDSISAADAVMIETDIAKANLVKFLAYYDEINLSRRIFVQAHYVPDDLLSCDVRTTRPNKIAAIGRWGDPQKDATLMKTALTLYLEKHPDTEIVLIGQDSQEIFCGLEAKFSGVRCMGKIPRSEVKTHLADSRAMFFTSRWEGAPVSASEMLALGGTIVGPPIPGIEGFCSNGRFGTVSVSRKPTHMVEALEKEMSCWQQGVRNSDEIANYWRPRLSSANSLQQIINLVRQLSSTLPEDKPNIFEIEP